MPESSTPWKKILGIATAVLTPVLVAVFTPIGEPIGNALKEALFPTKIDLEGRVIKGEVPLRNLEVQLVDYPSQTTDNKGVFLFPEVRTGAHKIIINYGDEPHRYNLRLGEGEEHVQLDAYDLGIVAIDPNDLSEDAEDVLIDSIEEVVAPNDGDQTATLPESESEVASTQRPTETGTQQPVVDPLPVAATPTIPSIDDIVSQLSIQVYIDNNDKSKSGKQKAYRYSLEAPSSVLDQVKEARYIRNHNTFSEKANNTYQAGYSRGNNFEFSGYQWGGVKTTYLSVVTVGGEQSDWILKDLVYVK